jgi:Tol biopolymer transport system component
MRTRRTVWLFWMALIGLSLSVAVAGTASALSDAAVTTRVSVAPDGTQANYHSDSPSISADGRYVAYESLATNLSDNDSPYSDIFVYDRETGETELASVASDGAGGMGESFNPSLSADGRYVAFYSWADNLAEGDKVDAPDIFVHDRETEQTTLVSVGHDGSPANGDSYRLSISGNGRYVAFTSKATNLTPQGGNGLPSIFVRDLQTRVTTRVSVSTTGAHANADAGIVDHDSRVLSADGRYVTFVSSANNLVAGDTNTFCNNDGVAPPDNCADVFVHDRQTGETTLVSVASDGTQGNSTSYLPSISADGRFVAFSSTATTLVPGVTDRTVRVYVHDRETAETTRVSVNSERVGAEADSVFPVISGNGRYVAFQSRANNLVAGESNNVCDNNHDNQYTDPCYDLFLHDRETEETTLISGDYDGTPGNGPSTNVTLSMDGRFAAFTSGASNLVGGDTNNYSDVFVRDREPMPLGEPTAITGQSLTARESGEQRLLMVFGVAALGVAAIWMRRRVI